MEPINTHLALPDTVLRCEFFTTRIFHSIGRFVKPLSTFRTADYEISEMATYRSNVAAILRKPKSGRILVAERASHPGSWQFPQGGVDKKEDLIAALYREVEEETGIAPESYKIVECRTGYRYKFPRGKLKKNRYCGQIQTYFLCDYFGKKHDIDLEAHVQEFIDYRWILPNEFDLAWVPKFKHPVFKRVFHDFFGIKRLENRKLK